MIGGLKETKLNDDRVIPLLEEADDLGMAVRITTTD
jgi:hypothetical protein